MSLRDDFIVFGAPDIQQPEIDEVVGCLESRWLGTGPKVAAFERAFAEYKGVDPRLVAATNSCTAALHVSLIAAGLGLGDEVITTPLTFCATINAIIHAGATPVLADVDPVTMNIDPEQIERRITSRTRAILPVHFAGRPCDMDAIMAIARRHDLLVIDDCAHAIEAKYKGRNTGTFGDFGCFSFYVTKNITTGEGGMVIARSEEFTARIKRLALHGKSKDAWHRFSDKGYRHYYVMEAGFKYNMMDLQAAIGLRQLERVETMHVKRVAIWKQYQEAFEDLPLTLPAEPDLGTRHARHLFTVLVEEACGAPSRDELLELLSATGIGVGVHYVSIPEHPYYRERFGWRPEDWPQSHNIGGRTLSLPLSPNLSQSNIYRVIEAICQATKG